MNFSRIFVAIASACIILGADAAPSGWLKIPFSGIDTNIQVRTSQRKLNTASSFRIQNRKALSAATVSSIHELDGLERSLPTADGARIAELAKGLDNDWRRCFDFVRNNIRFVPYPGIMRGPERTLIDMEGNDADQAFLLVAILRAAGYSSATVIYEPYEESNGLITKGFAVSGVDALSWLGVENADGYIPSNYAELIFRSSGVDCSVYGDWDDMDNPFFLSLIIPHYWVSVKVGSETLYLDPSLKQTTTVKARNALKDMGYIRSTFVSSAGGTVNSEHSVRGLSYNSVASALNAYCANLKSAWTNYNEATSFFIGGHEIVQRKDDEYFKGGYFSEAPVDLLSQTSSYKNALRTKVVLTANGSSLAQFYLDEVGLRNVWLTATSAGVSLHLDDAVVKSLSTFSGASASLMVDVKHPRPTTSTYGLACGDENAYSLVFGFGGDNRNGIRRYCADKIKKTYASGESASSLTMRALLLFAQGHEWLAQTAMYAITANGVLSDQQRQIYNIGISGYNGSPYVDMANCYSHGSMRPTYLDTDMVFMSALEHSVCEQLNNIDAVSTVKILKLANDVGRSIFFANSNNVDSVLLHLSNYSEAVKSQIRATVDSGGVMLLPQDAKATLNQWTGTGYVRKVKSDGAISTQMAIGGGLNGGYTSKLYCPIPEEYTCALTSSYYNDGSIPTVTQSDPIAMPYGAFLDRQVDLSLNRHIPLSWIRNYDSRSNYDDSGLGFGWTHNFDATIVESTNPDAFFGSASVDAVIPLAVAATVVDDLLTYEEEASAGETARRWTLGALVANWWTDLLKNNQVSVKLGARILGFTKRPDGSYAPAPGVTANLTKSGGVFTLQERHGNKYVFNSDNKLASIADPSGNTTTLTYASGKLIKVETSYDASLTVSWSGNHISSVRDSAGRSVSYTYSNDCLAEVVDARGKIWRFSYDASSHCLVSHTNPLGQKLVENTYNRFNQVVRQVSPVGGVTTFGYCANRCAWDEEPNGGRLTQYFTDNGLVWARVDRDGGVTEYGHDGHNHVVMTIDPMQNQRSNTYGANDNLELVSMGNKGESSLTTMVYDSQNRVASVIDARGCTTRFEYDSCHRVVKMTSPDGSYKLNAWNSKGQLYEVKHFSAANSLLLRTVFTHDAATGLVASSTTFGEGLPSDGVAESFVYNAAGQVVKQTDPNGNSTVRTYDAGGLLLSIADACGGIARFEYSDAGNLISSTDPLNRKTQYILSASGKVMKTIYPDGSTVENDYDDNDERVAVKDQICTVTVYTRDLMGRVLSAQTPISTVAYAYDLAGNRTIVTNAAGEVSRTIYDSQYRPVEVVNGLGNAWRTEYDAAGNVISAITPRNKVSRFGYDELGRRVENIRSSGAVERFGFDRHGNMDRFVNAENATYMMFNDAMGRQLAVTNAVGNGLFAGKYDNAGNLVQYCDAVGNVNILAYDKCNRVTSISNRDGVKSFSYDLNGNLISSENAMVREFLVYDNMDRLRTVSIEIGAMSYLTKWDYDKRGCMTNTAYATGKNVARKYDADGRMTSLTDWLGHVWSFSYDGAGKLLSVASPNGTVSRCAYGRDGSLLEWSVGDIAGRRITRNADGQRIKDDITKGDMPTWIGKSRDARNTFNVADQITMSEDGNKTLTFAYDGNGSLTNVVVDGSTMIMLSYDADNRVANVEIAGDGISCQYDSLGNRVKWGGRYWIPDFTDPLKRPLIECDETGAAVRFYIWGTGRLLGFIDGNETLTVAHCDDYGSVIALEDMFGRNVFKANYGPNGEKLDAVGLNPTPFTWLGGHGVVGFIADDAVGAIYMTRHRLYSASFRRFLASDPMGLAGGVNLYAYGNVNPMNYIDPLGLCSDGTDETWKQISNIGSASLGGWGDHIITTGNGLVQNAAKANLDAEVEWMTEKSLAKQANRLPNMDKYGQYVIENNNYASVNKITQNSIKTGRLIKGTGGIVNVATAGYDIATSDNKPRAVVKNAGGIAGGYVGGVMFTAGCVIVTGGAGTPICIVVGVGGSIGGSIIGEMAATGVYDATIGTSSTKNHVTTETTTLLNGYLRYDDYR